MAPPRRDPHSQIARKVQEKPPAPPAQEPPSDAPVEVVEEHTEAAEQYLGGNVPVSNETQLTVDEMIEEHRRLARGEPTRLTETPPAPLGSEADDVGPGPHVGVPTEPPADGSTAAALAAMQKQIAGLTGEVTRLKSLGETAEGVMDAGPGGYPWQYYKRSDKPGDPLSGWVVIAPGGASPKSGQRDVGSYARYLAKGFKALTRYGVADVPTGDPRPGHEFVTILQNGGALEFPISQIVTCRWHLPGGSPVPGIVFPEYEAHKDEVRHFLCEDCDFEMYYLADDKQTAGACFRHLRRSSGDGSHGYGRREAAQVMRSQGLEPPTGQFAEMAARQDLEALREPQPTNMPA